MKKPRHLSIEATTKRHKFWRVYIVMVKPQKGEWYRPYRSPSMFPGAIVAYETRDAARPALLRAQKVFGKRSAYIQMCGAYK